MNTTTHPSSHPELAPGPASGPVPTPQRPGGLDVARPFGAHLRMSWWKPLIIVVATLVFMFVVQIALTLVVMIIEIAVFGRDPMSLAMTPLMMLAANLSLAAMGPLAVLLTAWLAKVPWRSVLSAPRPLAWRRWGAYFALFGALVLIGLGVMMLVAPDQAGLSSFALTGTSIGLLVVALLTTPLQAAGEELAFRGAIMPAVASWIRPARAAMFVGLIASSVIFGLVHMSVDPWLLTYYTVFGVCMAAMAVISRGLEAPIAFHVSNNLILMVISALFSGGRAIEIDRSVGMGGPFMLVFIALDVIAVGLVWAYERRRRMAEQSAASAQVTVTGAPTA